MRSLRLFAAGAFLPFPRPVTGNLLADVLALGISSELDGHGPKYSPVERKCQAVIYADAVFRVRMPCLPGGIAAGGGAPVLPGGIAAGGGVPVIAARLRWQ